LSASLLTSAFGCKSSSPTSVEVSATAESTQNLEETDEETAAAEPADDEATQVTGKSDSDAIQAVGNVDDDDEEPPVRPKVTPGDVKIDGGLDEKKVKRVVRKYRRGIMFCYDQTRKEHPDAAGNAVFESVIAADGTVESVDTIENELSDTGLADCVLGKMKNWGFPETTNGGSATVRIPFDFEAPASE
jgi:hypothetical protein